MHVLSAFSDLGEDILVEEIVYRFREIGEL